MRTFEDLTTLILEIRRDLAKSPVMTSYSVQATGKKMQAREAMNYSYSIPASAMPSDHHELAKIGAEYFPMWQDVTQMVGWLTLEWYKRIKPLDKASRYSGPSEEFHPELRSHKEGEHYGYTYRERCIGMMPSVEATLSRNNSSRRAFWPIFSRDDAYRASDLTRIPCTLGYAFFIRELDLQGPVLHVTNLQRSCDLGLFFLSDLWFTHLFQRELATILDVKMGNITHTILSFHAFIEGEIY